MINKKLARFNDLGIRYKLLISYLLLIAVPLVLFLFINTFVTSRETEKQALYSARRVLSQTKSYLEYKTESIRYSLNFLSLNDTIQEILTRRTADYYRDIGLWSLDSSKLFRVYFTAQYNPDISHIHLYMKHGLALIFQNEDFINLNKADHEAWYQKLITSGDTIRWFPQGYFPPIPNKQYVYALRHITSEQNLSESIGVIKADIPEKVFRTILDQALFTKSTSAILLNNNREIICTSSDNSYHDPKVLTQFISRLQPESMEESVWKTIKYRKEKLLIGAQNINKSDWTLLLIIPYRDILELSVKSRHQMMVVFLIIALLIFPLAFLAAASATDRLQKLTQQIRQVENGNFKVAIPAGSNDEIGKLTRNFNYMLTKISTLMTEEYRLGQEIKNLELKALQAQINPHFLYNTLDLINWMAVRANVPEIRRLVEVLSKFYRLSLSKGEDLVTIKNELEHVKAYVEIQNMRFSNSIKLEINVPEALYDYMILKLVLQPIVENSILHGILEKPEETGIIRISGEMNDGIIRLYVEDDGVGMPKEKISQIITQGETNEHHGYGVKNINDRLKLNYGNEFGLSYQSEPGRGTILTMIIPARKRES